MRSLAPSFVVVLASAALSSGCPSGFETDSAYEQETYLCDPTQATAWADAVEACRQEFVDDASCAGVLSMRGMLQGVPVVFTTRLTVAQIDNVMRLDASQSRSDISLRGFSPYFGFDLTAESLGGPLTSAPLPRELTVGFTADPATRYDDNTIEAAIRIAAGLDSRDINMSSGTFTFTVQEAGETAGTFEVVGYGVGNEIEGCFHGFDANPSLTPEQP